MDPNATLKELRELVKELIERNSAAAESGKTDLLVSTNIGNELAEKIDSLDSWILRGGFLPQEWAERNTDTLRLKFLRREAAELNARWGESEHTDVGEANEFLQLVMKEEPAPTPAYAVHGTSTGRMSSKQSNIANAPKCEHGFVSDCLECGLTSLRAREHRSRMMSANFGRIYGQTVDLFETFQGALQQLRLHGPIDNTPVTRRELEGILRGIRDSFPRLKGT